MDGHGQHHPLICSSQPLGGSPNTSPVQNSRYLHCSNIRSLGQNLTEFYDDDPEIAEIVHFMDQKNENILWSLNPEIVKMDQQNFGSRNSRSSAVSGSRNHRNISVSGSSKNEIENFWIQKS